MATLEEITDETIVWTPDLDVVTPIDTNQIPGFVAWVEWNGCSYPFHKGYDFAAYIHTDGVCVLGLPQIEVKAVADGIAFVNRKSFEILGDDYFSGVIIKHNQTYKGLRSLYSHLIPSVIDGQRVTKGEPIGTLYKAPGNEEGQLVHLHFILKNAIPEQGSDELVYTFEPCMIFPELIEYGAWPQTGFVFDIYPPLKPSEISESSIKNFRPLKLPIEFAHFKKIDMKSWLPFKKFPELFGQQQYL